MAAFGVHLQMNQNLRYLIRSLVWLGLACFSSAASARDPLPEYTLKAGYLYNFAILTQWPEQMNNRNFELCFYGNSELGWALQSISGKKVNQQNITIREIKQSTEASNCHLLFIAESDNIETSRMIQSIALQPILTVTEDLTLVDKGVMILLRPEGKRLVFEIDHNTAKKSQLNISSRLLRLAKAR
jgi:hypothetical protein